MIRSQRMDRDDQQGRGPAGGPDGVDGADRQGHGRPHERDSLIAAGLHLLVVGPTVVGFLAFLALTTVEPDIFALLFLLPGGFSLAGAALAAIASRRYVSQSRQWLAFQAAQAAALAGLWFLHLLAWVFAIVAALILIGFVLMIPLAVFTLGAAVLSVVAAARTYAGADYEYPWLGRLVRRRGGFGSWVQQ